MPEPPIARHTIAWMKRCRALVLVASQVLVRQLPGSAKVVIFLTLEVETGISNNSCRCNPPKTLH